MPNGYQVINRRFTYVNKNWLRLLGAGLAFVMIAGCTNISLNDNAPIEDYSKGESSSSTSNSSSGGGVGTYTVQKGDTLRSIANKYNTDWRDIARLNNMTEPYTLKIGQVLTVSSDSVSSGTEVTSPGVEVMPVDSGKTATKPSTASTSSSVDAGPNAIKWIWPYSGDIIAKFGDRNKGIDIGGKLGDKVVAAAAGKVLFSGNDVPGYGNLIIIMHNDSYMSTYAHNSKLLVKKDDVVTQGQAIAELGQSDTSSPRLHFEIRKSGVSAADPKLFAPVDPIPFLPKK